LITDSKIQFYLISRTQLDEYKLKLQSIEKTSLSQIEKISELKNENLELKEVLEKCKAENSKLVSEFNVKTEVFTKNNSKK
jgi:predicted nuclease with TOPRIM domain